VHSKPTKPLAEGWKTVSRANTCELTTSSVFVEIGGNRVHHFWKTNDVPLYVGPVPKL